MSQNGRMSSMDVAEIDPAWSFSGHHLETDERPTSCSKASPQTDEACSVQETLTHLRQVSFAKHG